MPGTRSMKQPAALLPMLGTEMWERYGFYVVQSLLAIFLTLHLGYDSSVAYTVSGTFTALAYITPVIGGIIADKLTGQRLAVFLGCFTLLFSYVFMAVFYGSETVLYIALSGIAVGTGLLKPNISCLVGTLYDQGDSRRDGGFAIYYAGMAFGILLGTTIPYSLQHNLGWRIAFASPAIALAVAAVVFYAGIRYFRIRDNNRVQHTPLKIALGITISLGLGVLNYILFDFPEVASWFFISLAVTAFFIVIGISMGEPRHQRNRTLSFLVLCVISVLFWMLYFQMFMSLMLFLYHCARKDLLGLTLHPTYYVALQSLGLVVLGPLLSPIWSRFYLYREALDAGVKFTAAILFMVLAFGLILLAIISVPSQSLVSPWWLIIAYLCVAMAELLLSPVGLSMSTKLVRPQLVGLMTGIFFVSLGIGGYLAGQLAKLASFSKNLNLVAMKSAYLHAFSIYELIALAIVTITAGAVLILWRLNKRQHV